MYVLFHTDPFPSRKTNFRRKAGIKRYGWKPCGQLDFRRKRPALPVLPPAQTKPVLPQGIHPARPPPQGHKNPALIFPVHAGRDDEGSSKWRFSDVDIVRVINDEADYAKTSDY